MWLIARHRTERLTDAETVRLGRQRIGASSTSRVSYPDGVPTATAVVRDYTRDLSARAYARAEEVLGEFDVAIREP